MIATMTFDTLEFSPALEQQGLTLRNWRDDSDFEKMSRVLIASRNADELEEARTGEDLRVMYARMKNFDAARNLFLVEHENELVGYAGCRWSEEHNNNFVHSHWIFVLPEWRRRGIENELLRVSQACLRQAVFEHPRDATNWFEMFTADSQSWMSRVLQADAYEPVRYFFDMVCEDLQDIPDAELPEGIEVRPALREHMRQICEAEYEAFQDHWGEAVEDESDFERWMNNPKWNLPLWQVAWDGDQVVGMVLSYIDENENKHYGYKRGYTENISVRKPWRGRGIAKALLVRAMKMFRDMGFEHTALGVDSENATGALHLYESVGYKTVRTVTIYRKRMEQVRE